jgi:competence protein ComEA
MKNSSVRTLVFLCLIITAVAVFIHAVNEEISKPQVVSVRVISESRNEALININTADKETLMKLNGIGQVRAQQIIDFRTKNGMFVTAKDLMRIDGIGLTLFEKIKNDITV